MGDKFGEVDFKVPPSEHQGLAFKDEISANLKYRLPDFSTLIWAVEEELHIVTRRFFTETTNKSAVIIGNHAFNDYIGLVDSLLIGDGRSAARVSRSLFEHLVNYCEVMTSATAAERYLEHKAVTADLLANLTRGLHYLKGVAQKRERNRLAKLKRDALLPLKRVLTKFGPAYRRDWSSRNLYDRAKDHGYESHYDTYRLLSQVTHGSYGGVLGSHAEISGASVHRIGPSLDLAILSYLEGLTFFRSFASEVGSRQSVDTGKLTEAIDALLSYWPTYRQGLLDVDKYVWPASPPPSPIAVMALYPSGRIRWFFFEPALSKMKLADPPPNCEWMEERFREYVEAGNVALPANMDGRPITSAVSGVQVTPKADAQWVTAAAFLLPKRETTP